MDEGTPKLGDEEIYTTEGTLSTGSETTDADGDDQGGDSDDTDADTDADDAS